MPQTSGLDAIHIHASLYKVWFLMTLIAFTNSNEFGCVGIADVQISLSKAVEGDPSLLPLQFGLENAKGTHAIRIGSKASTFGDYLVLWSGPLDSANLIIKAFKALSNPEKEDFQRVLESMPQHSESLNIIYAKNDGNSVWSCSWKCGVTDIGGVAFDIGGSGAEIFSEPDIAFKIDQTISSKEFGAGSVVMQRLGVLINRELTQYMHIYDEFGGAYEIFVTNKEGGFSRLSYQIVELSAKLPNSAQWLDRFIVSRIVCCHSEKRSSRFTVFINTNVVQPYFKMKPFLVEELGGEVSEYGELSFDCDVSFCYVIHDKFYWQCLPEMRFVKLSHDSGKYPFKLDFIDEDIQAALSKYGQLSK